MIQDPTSESIGWADILRTAPLWVIFLTSLFPITVKVLQKNMEPSRTSTLAQGLGGILFGGILLLTVCQLLAKGASPATAFAHALVFDGLTLWLGLIVLMAGAMSLLFFYDSPLTQRGFFSETVFLVLNAVVGSLIVISAVDLLMVFIGVEMTSLAVYLIIAMSREQKLAKESAIKYFVLGGVASAFFLYGVSFVYGTAGGTYIPDIIRSTPQLASVSRIFVFGLCFLLVGLAFKIALFPFHAWAPDVYQGAATPVTVFLSTVVKVGIFGAILRLVATRILLHSEGLLIIFQWLAVLTMVVGNVGAMIQTNLKRMIAYSSIAHTGYLMVGVVAMGVAEVITPSATSLIFYLFTYSVMTIGALALVNLMEGLSSRGSEGLSITLESLAGYGQKHPVLALSFALILLSLGGIPPLMGFFAKFYLFGQAVGEGLLWMALWGVLNSVVSAYYYLRPIAYMYMKAPVEVSPSPIVALAAPLPGSWVPFYRALNSSRGAVLLGGCGVLFLGLISGWIFTLIEKSLN